ncbi:Bacterial extracellular solute-binding protein, family 3 [Piscirickettsia salmonis]|uniref:ABC transporter substrate-binding protein n=1 Tax=Piscirickettsia salmonis TaxID=1238 RepID=A0A1L6T9P3_PISSA|nr:transporter substrate-binding domain-containing protein [Piscirickettsia salmonis]AKP73171.1 ABC transporter substrate-binding protein [Piscirickettsia salmonis LF-89 = ATCC VR-1361]ALB21845.1 ABC transporter substrate-binding protein [Piscirickettsia salmonis]ALY02022.1 ABC transporter substrate-binding protein [Piscirickettsia salmonis]AMA41533.1 ABC transporter substrate-binding protein [Piscirickettsia salmonis]AOS34018.1 ABC transporter substrate-binding protein [Piscirickettsia salmon
MKIFINLISVLALCGFNLNVSYSAERVIKLTMDDRPPFHYLQDGKLKGPVIETLQCIFTHMQQAYDVEVVSWSRAQHYVKVGYADGFFAASHNKTRDQYARLSYPFVDQYWSWFTLKSKTISKKQLESKSLKVSSWKKSNSQHWLEKNGYNFINYPPQEISHLVNILRAERVAAIFGSNIAIYQYLKRLRVFDQIKEIKVVHKPMGLYMSHRYLKENPEFLRVFNEKSKKCL